MVWWSDVNDLPLLVVDDGLNERCGQRMGGFWEAIWLVIPAGALCDRTIQPADVWMCALDAASRSGPVGGGLEKDGTKTGQMVMMLVLWSA